MVTYPFVNQVPLHPFALSSTVNNSHSGRFVMGAGTDADAQNGPSDPENLRYYVDLRLDYAENGRKQYYGESFHSDALLPGAVYTFSRTEAVGAIHVTVKCQPLPPDGPFETLIATPAPDYVTAKQVGDSTDLDICAPPYRSLTGALASQPGKDGTLRARVSAQSPLNVQIGRAHV